MLCAVVDPQNGERRGDYEKSTDYAVEEEAIALCQASCILSEQDPCKCCEEFYQTPNGDIHHVGYEYRRGCRARPAAENIGHDLRKDDQSYRTDDQVNLRFKIGQVSIGCAENCSFGITEIQIGVWRANRVEQVREEYEE